jgi:hypothetical protein
MTKNLNEIEEKMKKYLENYIILMSEINTTLFKLFA